MGSRVGAREHQRSIEGTEEGPGVVTGGVKHKPFPHAELFRECGESLGLLRVGVIDDAEDVQLPRRQAREGTDGDIDPLVGRESRGHDGTPDAAGALVEPEGPPRGRPRQWRTGKRPLDGNRTGVTCEPGPLGAQQPSVRQRVHDAREARETVVVAHPGDARSGAGGRGQGEQRGLHAVRDDDVGTGGAQVFTQVDDARRSTAEAAPRAKVERARRTFLPAAQGVAAMRCENRDIRRRLFPDEPLLPHLGAAAGARRQHDADPQGAWETRVVVNCRGVRKHCPPSSR